MGVELGGLVDLVGREWLAAHGDVVVSKELQDAAFREAVAAAEFGCASSGFVGCDDGSDGVSREASVDTVGLGW